VFDHHLRVTIVRAIAATAGATAVMDVEDEIRISGGGSP
jgi:hypothetical protein